jgi:hypothetical protein
MRDDEIDRVLSSETEILPSSGFVSAVMDVVRSEAAAPPPIPFPWKRAVPGFAASVALLVWLVLTSLRLPAREAPASSILPKLGDILGPGLRAAETSGGGWILLSLLVTLLAVKLSLRLAARR